MLSQLLLELAHNAVVHPVMAITRIGVEVARVVLGVAEAADAAAVRVHDVTARAAWPDQPR